MVPLLLLALTNGATPLVLRIELARLTVVQREIRKVVVNE